jgi:Cu(I)/Ag(I) efflux system protein CusF
MQRIIFSLAIALAALSSTVAVAQDRKDGAQAAAPAAGASTPLADGEVRRVDRQQGKVTLKHGEIRNLEMPPMTMAFRVRDPAMLDRLNVGDKVQFSAEQIDGSYVVTRIEAAR